MIQRSQRRDSLPYSAATAKLTKLSGQWLWKRMNTIWGVCSIKICSKWYVLVATYVTFFHLINNINYVSHFSSYSLIHKINLSYSTSLSWHYEEFSPKTCYSIFVACLKLLRANHIRFQRETLFIRKRKTFRMF
jgi:hypothetical protein